VRDRRIATIRPNPTGPTDVGGVVGELVKVLWQVSLSGYAGRNDLNRALRARLSAGHHWHTALDDARNASTGGDGWSPEMS
jgi:hypothetical protein